MCHYSSISRPEFNFHSAPVRVYNLLSEFIDILIFQERHSGAQDFNSIIIIVVLILSCLDTLYLGMKICNYHLQLLNNNNFRIETHYLNFHGR